MRPILIFLFALSACGPTPPPSCRGTVFQFNPSLMHPTVASAAP